MKTAMTLNIRSNWNTACLSSMFSSVRPEYAHIIPFYTIALGLGKADNGSDKEQLKAGRSQCISPHTRIKGNAA